jgi:hypothetical protein
MMLLGLGGRLARDVSPVCFLTRFKEKKTSSAYTAILEVSSHMQSDVEQSTGGEEEQMTGSRADCRI